MCLMTVKSKLSSNNDVILCAYYTYHVIYIFTVHTFNRIVSSFTYMQYSMKQ